MKNFKRLQVGDVIKLTKGMTVYATIPKCFAYKTVSKEPIKTDIRIGQKYEKYSVKRRKYLNKLRDFVKAEFGVEPSEEKLNGLIDLLQINFEAEYLDTTIFEGYYKVVSTVYNGGTGGINGKPNCWHAYCRKIGNPEIKVDFFQHGDFRAVLYNIAALEEEEIPEEVKDMLKNEV